MAYVTVDEFKQHADITSVDHDALIETIIDAASAEVDMIVGASYELADEPYVLTYDSSNDGLFIFLDPFVGDVLSVEYEGQPFTDYTVRTDKAGNTWLKGNFGRHRAFDVEARWGVEEIPSAIKLATLMIANKLWQRRQNVYGIEGSVDTGVVRVTGRDRDVELLLSKYRKGRFA